MHVLDASVDVTAQPEALQGVSTGTPLIQGDRVLGTLGDVVQQIINREDANAEVRRRSTQLFARLKTRADLEKRIQLEVPFNFDQPVTFGGASVLRVRIKFACVPRTGEVAVDHYKLGDARVAHAVIPEGDGGVSFTLTRWRDTPNKILINTRPLDLKTGAGKRVDLKKQVRKPRPDAGNRSR